MYFNCRGYENIFDMLNGNVILSITNDAQQMCALF